MNSTRTIAITGAAGALGRAVVDAFLARNARLVLIDQSAALLESAFPALRERDHLLMPGDVTDATSMRALFQQAIAQTGRIDALAHIAGGFSMGEGVAELSRATWDHMLNLNAWSFVAVTSAVAPQMKSSGGGQIVAVSARAAGQGVAHMSAYCAAKSALQRLVESLSAELREHGVRVNSVAPSIVDTPTNRSSMPDADITRWADPRRLAEVIVFLCSEAAADVHGQHLIVSALS